MRIDDIKNKHFKMIFLDTSQEDLYIDYAPTSPLVIITKSSTSSLNIYIKENLNVEILEIISNEQSSLDFNREINIKENSNVVYNKLQLLDTQSIIDYSYVSNLSKNAKLSINLFEFGSKESTSLFTSQMNNSNSSYKLNGLISPKEDTIIKNKIVTTHNNKYTKSSLDFRHILNDYTKATFDAKSIVNKEALYAEAFQNSKTILLSDNAVIFANPHLEINIDELKASHGATTGTLNQDELFYLKTRGIKAQKAQKILLQAIEAVIYDKISDKNLKEYIQNLIGEFNE